MKLFLKTKDFSVSGETFELFKDENLDMLVTRPQPENLFKYYESEDYISHTDAKKSLMDKMYQVVKRKNLKNKIQLIENQLNKPKSLLDIGAGTGDFLLFAKSRGFEVLGVEPNEKARQLSSQKGIPLSERLEEVADQRYDAITLWHVLEHLPNLDDQIKTIASLLKDDGVLVIAVPNFKSYDASHYGKYWAAYDVPRHLWHFSKTSITKLFDAHGLEVIAIKPMWFDSFYVSLLSEKYKGNKLYWLSAFFVGLASNINALFTKECSSLVYLLKKKK
ncbi:class I SAM-dependent methyltransferase [Flagellimonas sediminis]|uniref:Methyltransferase domain-containing protein n=1 Tax=Flagellimonas sediminis TaxID=2696468 RepID=A0A6I5KMR5_9FLAO|nr:class I SAM-dependent methyltransferase [Allomuricauda sediminis]NDV42124.1 methyltransferase domain-containing protein [Allomuricauda sediminis]